MDFRLDTISPSALKYVYDDVTYVYDDVTYVALQWIFAGTQFLHQLSGLSQCTIVLVITTGYI